VSIPWPVPGRFGEERVPEDLEADLIADCRSGRREAYERLVATHYDRLHRLAFTMTGSIEDARDLTQETFLAAIKSLPAFRGGSKLSTWLISIMRNQFTVYLRGRRKWRFQTLEAAEDRPQPPPEEPVEPALRSILDRVKDLPEDIRTTLVLFYLDGMKYTEIAEAMECPVGTVRSRLFEARERLKKMVATEA
jgi:RNA polymerase sigma-70 factor (ECF subfamily)